MQRIVLMTEMLTIVIIVVMLVDVGGRLMEVVVAVEFEEIK